MAGAANMSAEGMETYICRPTGHKSMATEVFDLSDIDMLVPPVMVPHLFFYSLLASTPTSRRQIVETMRAGLEKTAAQFPILTGRVHHMSGGNIRPFVKKEPNQSHGEGIVLVARGIEHTVADTPPYKTLESANFHPSDFNAADLLPMELYSTIDPFSNEKKESYTSLACVFQVTFIEGGMILGTAMNHYVADGPSIDMFVNAWAANSRGTMPLLTPDFDRFILNAKRKLGADQLQALEEHLVEARGLAVGTLKQNPTSPSALSSAPQQKFKPAIIRVGCEACEDLKSRIISQLSINKEQKLSALDCLAALIWRCLARAKAATSLADSQEDVSANLYYVVGFRGSRNVDFPANYFGNAATMIRAGPSPLPALLERDLIAAVGKVALEIRQKVQGVNMSAINELVSFVGGHESPMVFGLGHKTAPININITSWAANSCYKAYDFGFGLPSAFRPPNLHIEVSLLLPINADLKDGREHVEVYLGLEGKYHEALVEDEEFRAFANTYSFGVSCL